MQEWIQFIFPTVDFVLAWSRELSFGLPSAKFHEAPEALNGALTAVCIVLPEYMYNPQYATVFDTVVSGNDFLPGLQISNEYKDLETGNVLHRYSQYDKDLITAIKALRLKGA